MTNNNEKLKIPLLFIFLYLLFFLSVSFFYLLYTKTQIHLFLNHYHAQWADFLFKYITHLGDGLFVIILILFFLFFRIRYSLAIFFSYAISGIIVQIMKHSFNFPRPIKYFEGSFDLHIVEGVKMLSFYSFPSGHAATAFAVSLVLAYFFPKKIFQVFLFIAALLVAYSRVYLSQHFLNDIWMGSLIGILVTILYFYFDTKLKSTALDKPLIKIFKNKL